MDKRHVRGSRFHRPSRGYTRQNVRSLAPAFQPEFYQGLVHHAHDLYAVLDERGTVIFFNPATQRVLGYAPETLIGTSIFPLLHPSDIMTALMLRRSALNAPNAVAKPVSLRLRHADGRWRIFEVTVVNRLDDPDVRGGIVYAHDVTERGEAESERERLLQEARERANYDPLTGLLNHRTFHKQLDEEVARANRTGRPFSLLLLDLDNFTYINDVYGHAVGDQILKIVADELTCCQVQERLDLLPKDVTMARWGDDEFALVVPNSDLDSALLLAQMLTERLARIGFQAPGETEGLPLTFAVGVAVYPHDGLTRLQTLGAAQERLRRSKTSQPENERAELVRQRLRGSKEGYTVLDALLTAVDHKDHYTRRHSEDVMVYGVMIAEELGFSQETIRTLEVAALLHDVGKIGVPDSVLQKPGKLTPLEMEAMRQHPILGTMMVGAIPGFEETLDIVQFHHERWDGTGYPAGLQGEMIPDLARLLSVADAYSAMTTDRPYRKGMSAARAQSVLESGMDSQWDARFVQAFLAALRRAQGDYEGGADETSGRDWSGESRAA